MGQRSKVNWVWYLLNVCFCKPHMLYEWWVGTWNFYIFGGANRTSGLLLPSPRPVIPTTEVILISWTDGFSSQRQAPISGLLPLLSAAGQCPRPQTRRLVQSRCLLLPIPSLPLAWISSFPSELAQWAARDTLHINTAPWTWLLVWAVPIFDYLLSKLQLKLQRT